jgi:hypothetical protein
MQAWCTNRKIECRKILLRDFEVYLRDVTWLSPLLNKLDHHKKSRSTSFPMMVKFFLLSSLISTVYLYV